MNDSKEKNQAPDDLAVTLQLADIAANIEEQGEKQQKLLISIFNQVKRIGQQGTVTTTKGTKDTKNVINNADFGTKDTETVKRAGTNNAEKSTKEEQKEPKKVNNGRLVATRQERKRPKKDEEVTSDAAKGTKDTSEQPIPPVQSAPVKSAYNPASSRESRTIVLGTAIQESGGTGIATAIEPVSQPAAESPASEVKPPAQTETKKSGYYTDAGGRLRRSNGEFASRVEIRRYTRERNRNVDDATAQKQPAGLLAKALAMLRGDSAKNLAESDAADAAGVAAGGSFWRASKEIAETFGDFKQVLADRNINSISDARKQAGDALGGLWARLSSPFRNADDERKESPVAHQQTAKKVAGSTGKTTDLADGQEPPIPVTADKAAPQPYKAVREAKMATRPTPAPKQDSSSRDAYGSKRSEALSKVQAQDARDQSKTQHAELLDRLDDVIDAIKPHGKGVVDSVLDMAGDVYSRRKAKKQGRKPTRAGDIGISLPESEARKEQPGRVAREPAARGEPVDVKGKPKGKAKGKTSTRRGSAPARRLATAVQAPVSIGQDIADYSEEIRDVADMASGVDMPERGGKAGTGKVRTRAGARVRTAPGKVGRMARMRGVMPRIMPALGSVLGAGGLTGGVLAKAPSAIGALAKAAPVAAGGLARGALRMGARAIPIAGNLAMAAYDAYSGYHDTAGQQHAFGVLAPQDVTTGQKASMTAAHMLDLGGLVSGGAGLLADGAGALGMKNTQDMLTFNTEDIAKKVYGLFSTGTERSAMGLQPDQQASIGQSIAISVGKTLDMGGMLSGTLKTLGKVVEDLGVDGAAKATDFDTGDLVTALYKMFGGDLPNDKDNKGSQLITINNSRYSAPGAASQIGITEADVKQAGKQYDFSGIEQQAGLPEGFMSAMAGVESNGDPLATNPSGAKGMFQLMPRTAEAYGVTNPFDVNQSATAVAQLARDNAQYFTKQVGRAPEARELYLMHQQGMGGGVKLLQNPDSLAIDQVGMQAVMRNGGRADMSAKEFADLQMGKYDKHYLAQRMAREQGAQPIAPEKAVSEAIHDVTPSFPIPYSKDGAPASLVAQRQATGKAAATPITSNFAGMLDIQNEQAKSRAQNGQDTEVTAKMDPQMTTLLKSIDATLKDSSKQQGSPSVTHNNAVNITAVGQHRTVSDHDGFSSAFADMAKDRG